MKGFDMTKPNPIVIMAAGKGSRMKAAALVSEWEKEEAATRPKAMIRIGRAKRPLLHHLVEQCVEEGMRDICVVVAEDDRVTAPHFRLHPVPGAAMDFVVQRIAPGRTKPNGTAEAVQLALHAHPDWEGCHIAVANGDNLPPKGLLERMLLHPSCLPAMDANHLGLPADRVRAFAVIHRTADGKLAHIEEKPSPSAIESCRWPDGSIRVSMNCFRMAYADLRNAVEQAAEHPTRKERELPAAISSWNQAHPGVLTVLPLAGAFLDLTHPQDIQKAGVALDAGGHRIRN